MDDRELALYFFRKTVYALYLEIGSLKPRVHPQLARKAFLKTAYFQREKERQAADLYHLIENETDTTRILAPFLERTGLTLEDVYRAFAEGNWQNKFGTYTTGGPRWLRIAEVTKALREKIDQQAWEETQALVFELKGLKTNQGYLINQFERTERRR